MARDRKRVWQATERSLAELDTWLHVEQWQYVRLGERLAVLRLLAGLGSQPCPPAASLVVARGDEVVTYPARGCRVEPTSRPRLLGGELMWHAYFAVPLGVVEYSSSLFTLTAPGQAALALPAPDLRALTTRAPSGRFGLLPAAPVRRRLVVVAATMAITGSTPGVAMAVSRANGATGRPHRPPVAHAVHGLDSLSTIAATPAASLSPLPVALVSSGGAVEGPATGKGRGSGKPPGSRRPRRTPVAHVGRPASGRVYIFEPAPRAPVSTPPPAPPPAEPFVATGSGSRHADGPAHHRHSPSGGASIASPRPPRNAHRAGPAPPRSDGAPTSASASPPAASTAPASHAGANLGAGSAASTAWTRLSRLLASGDRPPAFLVPIYKAAGRRYHVPWAVLAAINSIETDYGRDVSTSSAGAIGWMQFMPSTWAEYGVAAGRHRRPDPYDPRDAILSAARYLAANGAAHHLRRAIFAYNHATWYVDEVLWTAASVADDTPARGSRARAKLAAMGEMALALEGEPYIWGGGHSNWELAPGYDCSGFVSTVLHAAGYLDAPVTTQTLPGQPNIFPGPGRYVTIFDRTDGGADDDDHMIIDLNGKWWESGGSNTAGGAPDVHRITSISAAYLLSFNEILHPRGL